MGLFRRPAALWTRGGLGWRRLVAEIWKEMVEDEVFDRSAELAFYFLYSIFPLLLFFTALVGYLVEESIALRQELYDFLAKVVPSREAVTLVRSTVREIVDNRAGKLPLGLAMWVLLGSQAIMAVGRVLDAAFEVEKRRSLWRAQLVGAALTVFFVVLTVAALGLIFQGGAIADVLAARFSFGDAFTRTWRVLQWPVVLAFVLLAFELVYNFAPGGVRQRGIHWFTPGALVAVGVWILASYGFKLYIAQFDYYSLTYGSLGTLIVLMLWFYMTGFAVLLGGEINSELVKLAEGRGAAAGPRRRRPPAGARRPSPS